MKGVQHMVLSCLYAHLSWAPWSAELNRKSQTCFIDNTPGRCDCISFCGRNIISTTVRAKYAKWIWVADRIIFSSVTGLDGPGEGTSEVGICSRIDSFPHFVGIWDSSNQSRALCYNSKIWFAIWGARTNAIVSGNRIPWDALSGGSSISMKFVTAIWRTSLQY
jgi:hypothetical protein